MRRLRETVVNVARPDDEEALPMLRYSVVGHVEDAPAEAITDLFESAPDLLPGSPTVGPEDPIDVLEQEACRLEGLQQSRVLFEQCSALVVGSPDPRSTTAGSAEGLAGWPPDDEIHLETN